MKISIITVTKNNKAGLLRAIESVRSQTYKNVEHIVVDGGSTDGSVEVLKNLQLTIKNDMSSRAEPARRGGSRDLKDFSGASLLRNDKDRDDNENVILRQAQYDKAQGDTLRPATAGRQAQYDKGKEDKSSFANNYSLITLSEADSGIYDAINKGIKLATGDVIGLLHSDDFFKDEFVLERYAEAFQDKRLKEKEKSIPSSRSKQSRERDLKISPSGRNDKDKGDKGLTTDNLPPTTDNHPPTIDAVYSDLVYVRRKTRDEKLKKNNSESIDHSALNIEHSIIRYWKAHPSHFAPPRRAGRTYGRQGSAQDDKMITNHYSLFTNHLLLNGWMPPHPTLFVRKEVFEKYGLYRTDMKISADYEMVLRLFWKHKITSYYLPITTYCMTIGGASNKSLRNIFIKSSEDFKAMKMHGIPFPLKTLFMKNVRKLPQFFIQDKRLKFTP